RGCIKAAWLGRSMPAVKLRNIRQQVESFRAERVVAQWRNLDACGRWQEISPFRSQAPSSRNDNRVSHSERGGGISTSVAGGKRSLHAGCKLPTVERTTGDVIV